MLDSLQFEKARAYFETTLPGYLEDLRTLVSIETPSRSLNRLSEAASWLAARFDAVGTVSRQDLPTGPLLKVVREGQGPRVLVLAHYDTVHPLGSWPRLWREEDGRIYGPGVFDMKGGLLFVPWALGYLDEAGLPLPRLTVLLTPDEEIGSEASRAVIEREARQADLALVLEAPTPAGDLKVARKGVGLFRVRIKGRAAHQGVEPEKGVNAIVEAARFVLHAVAQEDRERGTTVGPNLIRGGFATNVVAPEAELEIDLRVWHSDEAERVEAALRGYRPTLAAEVEVRGGMNRPPMAPSPESLRLFELARELAAGLGFRVAPGKVGGGSDGNFTQALGVPTLDGLGPVGGDAHQPSEHVLKSELPRRGALFGLLLAALAGWKK